MINDSMRNPEMHHCVTCRWFSLDINQEPCRGCLDTEPVGRARPLWELGTGETALDRFIEDMEDEGGQLRLF
jgi:hypothetical protein